MFINHVLFRLLLLTLWSLSDALYLDCTFSERNFTDGHYIGTFYTCNSRIYNFENGSVVLGVSIQNHTAGKNHSDVEALIITALDLQVIPSNIETFLPNLKVLDIVNSNISSVKRGDFPFAQLIRISLNGCRIEILSSDVFEDLPNVEFIDFRANQLSNVGLNVLNPLINLRSAWFGSNPCINISFSDNPSFIPELRRKLSSKCPPTWEMMEKLILNGDSFIKQFEIQYNITSIDLEQRVNVLEEKVRILECEVNTSNNTTDTTMPWISSSEGPSESTTSLEQTTISELITTSEETTELTSPSEETPEATTSVEQTTISELTSPSEDTTESTTSLEQTTISELTTTSEDTTESTLPSEDTTESTTSLEQTTISELITTSEETTESTLSSEDTTESTTSSEQTTISELITTSKETIESTLPSEDTTESTTSLEQTTISELITTSEETTESTLPSEDTTEMTTSPV